ncbi:type VII secretion protein EccCb [Salininema proteolyticum]|uniref:Type VII secretion protein EccCb n=1 Tax=Salininema proteolyticum TaxID=1607685 RepID=A0ABV8U1L3_9ACTN
MTRRALLVANDRYSDADLAGLISPESDAMELGELLRDRDIGAFDHVDILVNDSKATIEERIERLFDEAASDDLVLLYFSGHGVRHRRRLHLAVSNTTVKTGLASTSVEARFIKDRIRDSYAESVVVLLDCCYSGAFVDAGFKSAPEIDLGEELESGQGVYILTATNALEEASDGSLGDEGDPGQSAFTSTIVEGLRTGAADVRQAGRISPGDLWEYVSRELPRRFAGQTPTQYGQIESSIDLARAGARTGPGLLVRRSDVKLADVLGETRATDAHGLRAEDWQGCGRLIVPIGQRAARGERGNAQPIALGDKGGHVLVVGEFNSGKSTMLRSLVCSLALTHDPNELRFEFFDSGANKLGSLSRLPHAGETVWDDDPDMVSRKLEKITELVRERKRLYRELGISYAEEFRARRRHLPGGPHPDLVVVIDQWSDFKGSIPGFGDTVERLANIGPVLCVHLVVATRRPDDLIRRQRDLLTQYVEMRLPDPHDSLVDPELARRLPKSEPGWALHGRTRFRVAVPWTGEDDSIASDDDGARFTVERIASAWSNRAGSEPDDPVETPAHGMPPVADDVPTVELEPVDPMEWPRTLSDVLGFDVGEFDPAVQWEPKAPGDRLKVPIGIGADGEPVVVDFKEAAQGGMGPHGLVIGATGSGKSEALRTIVGGLAGTHTPDELNFLLLDFKGGAAFHPLSALPHTSAVITNLADEPSLIERVSDSIGGEMVRRQEILRDAGNYANLATYESARAGGADLQPLPTLMVVVDEFAELLIANPDFIDVFLSIGRLGRSLGIHMLLSSQRIEEGKLRGLDAFLSYRIALRTFSASESRTVIGTGDAYELPQAPGYALLLTGSEELVRVRVAYSGRQFLLLKGSHDTELDTLVSGMRGYGTPAHMLWMPPLDEPFTLDQILRPLEPDPERGLSISGSPLNSRLIAVLGEEDRPREQKRMPFTVDLSGAGGSAAIVGGPQSGKSTMLRTMITSLSLFHTPEEAQFYCLDFGGGTLQRLYGLPHVAGVFGRRSEEGVRRTVQEVASLLDEREAYFAEQAIDGMSMFRMGKRRGRYRSDRRGDIFLVIDNWMAFREDFDDLVDGVKSIGSRGLAYGIHVIVAANRWGDIRMNMSDMFGTKLELKLAHNMESEIDRKIQGGVPANLPGRGVTLNRLHSMVALPRIDGVGDSGDLDRGVTDLVERVEQAWRGKPCPQVRLLPKQLDPEDFLKEVDRAGPEIAIGLDSADFQPVYWDIDRDPHLVVYGDAESGKTNLLRWIGRRIEAQFESDGATIRTVDLRRGMFGDLDKPIELMNPYRLKEAVQGLVLVIERRLPQPDVTPQQLRDRSWWSGPELFFLVDNYELAGSGRSNPFADLASLAAQGADLGLHLVIARRMSGVSRGGADPLLRQLRDLEQPTLVMSGPREEGNIVPGLRASPQPPGRGTFVTRKEGKRIIQTPFFPDPS